MINIKRPKSNTELVIVAASEHLFEIAAGLFVVMIVGLGGYIFVKSNTKKTTEASVAGISTTKGDQSKTDLLNTVAEGSNFKYFFDALTKTGLYKTLQEDNTYTVFAPEDSAFKSMSEAQLNDLFNNKDKLANFVKNHIVSGKLNRLDFDKVEFMRSLSGRLIYIKKNDFGTYFNSSKLMSSGTEATNGITYEIDNVIL